VVSDSGLTLLESGRDFWCWIKDT